MKYLVILFSIIWIVPQTFAQEEETLSKKELKQIAKEEKRSRRYAEEEQKRELTALMLEHHRFVLEADFVGDRTGSRIPVNSNINFIAIDSTHGTLQLATPYGLGYNGLGGITLEGRISKYNLKEIQGKKSKSYSLMILIMTSLGTYDITFQISETGNTDATVRGNSMGQLKYSGKLIPIDKSRVYKGSTL